MRKSEPETSFYSANGPEPMEVSQLRPSKSCRYCKKLGHEINECRRRPRDISAYTQARPQMQNSREIQDKGNWRDRIDCWTCGKLGHLSKECWYQGFNANQRQNSDNRQFANARSTRFQTQEN